MSSSPTQKSPPVNPQAGISGNVTPSLWTVALSTPKFVATESRKYLSVFMGLGNNGMEIDVIDPERYLNFS
jgi:hypothetical protein